MLQLVRDQSIPLYPQENVLFREQFQAHSTNSVINFQTFKKIYLSVLPSIGVTEELMDIICVSEKMKTENITIEDLFAYIKILIREIKHSQDSHPFGMFIGNQLLNLVNGQLVLEREQETLPVYKVPKELYEFLHQLDPQKRYNSDLLTDFQTSPLTYKSKNTYRLMNFQSETKEKDSQAPFTDEMGNKYSQLFRAAIGLQFKHMASTLKEMDQNDKELKVLKVVVQKFQQLQQLATIDRDLNKLFKHRNTFNCEAFLTCKKKFFFQISRNKALFLIQWCSDLSKTFKHPYLMSILMYWGNQKDRSQGMFEEISFNENISLADRFFFAKWNFLKDIFKKFIEKIQEIGCQSDKLEYILLFGRRPQSAMILQNYYDSTLNIETAALLSVYFIIGGFDGKTAHHQNLYQHLVNTYKELLINANKTQVLDVFLKKQNEIQAERGVIDDRHVSIRCNNCGSNLSLCAPVRNQSSEKKKLGTYQVLQQCPFCAEYAHRCFTCLVPVQLRNPGYQVNNIKLIEEYKKQSTTLDMSVVFCLKCKHGGHFFHSFEWFQNEIVCPIPGCGCQCYL